MFIFIKQRKEDALFSVVARLLVCVLSVSLIFSPCAVQAQSVVPTVLNLPVPGTMVTPSPAFVPVLLKGMTIHPDDPLRFDFIIDSGNTQFTADEVKKESERLVKYFLAAMTVPKDDLWVNLSPNEPQRIIPDELGKTELGRDMLAQDYILKQLTASLMYPEEELGKKFWDKVYKEAQKRFGTSEIPVNTFNKVWIVPETATVYEHEQTVYVVDAYLRVMLDEDYVAMEAKRADTATPRASARGQSLLAARDSSLDQENNMRATSNEQPATNIIREIIIPAIEKEVNEGAHFAPLRQIYHSLILAKWYKETIKNSLLSQVYADKNLIDGVDSDDPAIKDKVYAQYMEAYKRGVFNYIKEDYVAMEAQQADTATPYAPAEGDRLSQEMIPRKYFSGGEQLTNIVLNKSSSPIVGNGFDGEGYQATVSVTPQKLGISELAKSSSPIWTVYGAVKILESEKSSDLMVKKAIQKIIQRKYVPAISVLLTRRKTNPEQSLELDEAIRKLVSIQTERILDKSSRLQVRLENLKILNSSSDLVIDIIKMFQDLRNQLREFFTENSYTFETENILNETLDFLTIKLLPDAVNKIKSGYDYQIDKGRNQYAQNEVIKRTIKFEFTQSSDVHGPTTSYEEYVVSQFGSKARSTFRNISSNADSTYFNTYWDRTDEVTVNYELYIPNNIILVSKKRLNQSSSPVSALGKSSNVSMEALRELGLPVEAGDIGAWFRDGHPSSLYHDPAHSRDVPGVAYVLAKARGLSGEQALFLYRVGLLHDFDPHRDKNTPARVWATLQLLEDDFKRKKSLDDGQAGWSVLQDQFGWGKKEYLMAAAFIARSEHPFDVTHFDPAYKDVSPVTQYENLLNELAALDREAARFVVEWAPFFSEYADKSNASVIGGIRHVVDRAKALAVEFYTDGRLTNLDKDQFAADSYKSFFSTLGQESSFVYDREIAANLGFTDVKFLTLEDALAAMPAAFRNRFKANAAAARKLGEVYDQSGNFNTALSEAEQVYRDTYEALEASDAQKATSSPVDLREALSVKHPSGAASLREAGEDKSSSPVSIEEILAIPAGLIGALEEKGQALSVRAGGVVDISFGDMADQVSNYTLAHPVISNGLVVAAISTMGGVYYFWSRHTVSGNINGLKSGDSLRRSNAAEALGKLGVTKEQMVDGYLNALKSSNGFARSDAAEALGKLGDKRAVEPLIERLGDSDSYVRKTAAEALDKLGASKEQMVDGYLNALKSSDGGVHISAALALGWLGDQRAVEPLIERLGDSDSYVRKAAAKVLGELGDKRAVEPLIERLGDSDWYVRKAAAEALGKLGVTKEQMVDGYLNALESSHRDARIDAAKALGELGDQRALEPLKAILASTEWSPPYDAEETKYGPYGEVWGTENVTHYHSNHDLYIALNRAISQLSGGSSSPVMSQINTAMIDNMLNDRRISVDKIEDEHLRSFLKFLKDNDLKDIVVMGGFMKNLVFGEKIADIDLSYKSSLTDAQKIRFAPLSAFVSEEIFNASQKELSVLADKLGIQVSQFLPPHVGVKQAFEGLNVDYFGPVKNAQGQIVKRSLFDATTGQGYFTNTAAGLLRLGIDADGNIYGDIDSLRALKEGKLTFWGDGTNFGINDIVRVLRLKHQYGLIINNADYQLISNKVKQYERLILPETAVSMAKEQVDKLLENAQNKDEARKELDSLGITNLLNRSSTSTSSPVLSGDEPGGIDMNDINVNRQGAGVDIQFDPVEIQEIIDMGITGFAPVIINITPLPSVLPLLGLEPKKEEELELSRIN